MKEGQRTYNSSPMHQMLQRLVLQEDAWHSSHKFCRPEKLRLQLALRTTLLKIEVDPDLVPPDGTFSTAQVLLDKVKETVRV